MRGHISSCPLGGLGCKYDYGRAIGSVEALTEVVITMEQTMQARKLRCCPGGTKFSDMALRVRNELAGVVY